MPDEPDKPDEPGVPGKPDVIAYLGYCIRSPVGISGSKPDDCQGSMDEGRRPGSGRIMLGRMVVGNPEKAGGWWIISPGKNQKRMELSANAEVDRKFMRRNGASPRTYVIISVGLKCSKMAGIEWIKAGGERRWTDDSGVPTGCETDTSGCAGSGTSSRVEYSARMASSVKWFGRGQKAMLVHYNPELGSSSDIEPEVGTICRGSQKGVAGRPLECGQKARKAQQTEQEEYFNCRRVAAFFFSGIPHGTLVASGKPEALLTEDNFQNVRSGDSGVPRSRATEDGTRPEEEFTPPKAGIASGRFGAAESKAGRGNVKLAKERGKAEDRNTSPESEG
ncbi:hypothetical protein K438DRAFT_1788093 [Mycena galopus ATCC 62051]|nr:hypothetical protein K438DRAFT_1788093 [Mycena galopus ATCC 62051]